MFFEKILRGVDLITRKYWIIFKGKRYEVKKEYCEILSDRDLKNGIKLGMFKEF